MKLDLLHGVRVIDAGRLMPSSLAAFELAKLGADVIKLEFLPDGDYLRVNPPLIGSRGDMHLDLNRNKRSLCLNPNDPHAPQLVDRLLKTADAVIVAAAQQTSLTKLGLDYRACVRNNRRIVYCAISGYGQDGPYAGLAAHGLSSDFTAGAVRPDIDGDGNIRVPPQHISIGPRAAGLHAAIAILAALHDRDVNERDHGQVIDVSQWDSALAWNYRNLDMAANGSPPTPSYNDLGYRYALYATSDAHHILFAAPEPVIWRRFCTVVGKPDLASDAGNDPSEYPQDSHLEDELKAVFLAQSQAYWVALGLRERIPIAPVIATDDLPLNEHVKHRDMLVEVDAAGDGSQVRLTGHPTKFVDLTPEWRSAPELGQHSREVLRDSGLADDEIDRLVGAGTVYTSGPFGQDQ